MGASAQHGDAGSIGAGSVVRTLYGVQRVGVVTRIETVARESFFAPRGEGWKEVRVWVRWQDRPDQETDTAPEAISRSEIPVIEGLALVNRLAS